MGSREGVHEQRAQATAIIGIAERLTYYSFLFIELQYFSINVTCYLICCYVLFGAKVARVAREKWAFIPIQDTP